MLTETLSTTLIKQLNETFQDVTVYDEPVQQGMDTPSFNIKFTQVDRDRQLGNNVNLPIFFFITYTPGSIDKRTEMDAIAFKFLGTKAWKYLGDFAHIRNLKAKHNDEILVVSFSIELHGSYEDDPGDIVTKLEGGVTIDGTET